MNKRIVSLIMAFVLIYNFTGCQKKEKNFNETLRVGVVTYTQDDPFINAMTQELKDNLKSMENDNFRIIVSEKNGDDSQRDQDEVVEEMIDAGCDIMCVNLVDRTAPGKIIKLARQNNIPIIFFNREPVKEDLMQWNKLYYVGCDAEQSGVMQGQIAADYIKANKNVDKNNDGKIQYVLLEGEAGHQDAISRTDCSVKTIINNGINGNNGKGDTNYIVMMGVIMFVFALLGLVAGMGGGIAGAKASTGFAKNLREAMFRNIQTFSFSNIDKFSTAGLVTRLTTDVTNIQNAYQMILRMCVRAPFSLLVAMIMAFSVSPRVASVYLITVIILGIVLAIITLNAHKYFTQVFNETIPSALINIL